MLYFCDAPVPSPLNSIEQFWMHICIYLWHVGLDKHISLHEHASNESTLQGASLACRISPSSFGHVHERGQVVKWVVGSNQIGITAAAIQRREASIVLFKLMNVIVVLLTLVTPKVHQKLLDCSKRWLDNVTHQ